jgi:hypothetical protein
MDRSPFQKGISFGYSAWKAMRSSCIEKRTSVRSEVPFRPPRAGFREHSVPRLLGLFSPPNAGKHSASDSSCPTLKASKSMGSNQKSNSNRPDSIGCGEGTTEKGLVRRFSRNGRGRCLSPVWKILAEGEVTPGEFRRPRRENSDQLRPKFAPNRH